MKLTKPQKSRFDLSHERRMTVRPNDLVPILVTECLPSDKFNGSSEVLVRLAPLLAPIYERVYVYVHYFFVPNRLLWYEWEQFITGGRQGPGVTDVPLRPYFDIGNVQNVYYAEAFNKGSLADYLGCPIFGSMGTDLQYTGINVDAMPWLAYQKIYFDYYIDRNFTNEADNLLIPTNGGPADGLWDSYLVLRQRLYMKDYFTSALPFTQRGEEVLLPVSLSGYAPIVTGGDGSIDYWRMTGVPNTGGTSDRAIPVDTDAPLGSDTPGTPDESEMWANLDFVQDQGYAASINDFRSAYALQVWMERNAVGGSRYTESTQAHFGVRPQDSRLQRAEYIGGGRINIKISEVVSTAYSENAAAATVPLANLAGHGVSYGNTNTFNYFCTEHGFIMGILSIVIPPSYHQGLPRMFRRKSFLDYPWPTFAKLGEQQVDKAELYASPANLTEDADGNLPLFGYQSRYADWKYIPSTNHGEFHDTMLFWTGTINFEDSPELGLEFLTPTADTWTRWFAVESQNNSFWLYIHNRLSVSRPLPYFGTPNTLGFS